MPFFAGSVLRRQHAPWICITSTPTSSLTRILLAESLWYRVPPVQHGRDELKIRPSVKMIQGSRQSPSQTKQLEQAPGEDSNDFQLATEAPSERGVL